MTPLLEVRLDFILHQMIDISTTVLLTDLFSFVFSHCIHRDHRVCGYVDATNDCSNWKDSEAEWQAPSKQIDMKKERLSRARRGDDYVSSLSQCCRVRVHNSKKQVSV